MPISDVGKAFGSAQRLQGFIDDYALVPGDGQNVEGALAVVAHEIAHQWSGTATFRDPRTGQASQALLGLDGAHWSYYLDSDASVLYGADWLAGAGGTFSATATMKRYSALDLYLMGFLAPDELGPITLLQPSPGMTTPAASLPAAVGTRVAATPMVVTASDLVAAMGPRSPASSQAQASFRAAFVIVAAPGQVPAPEQLDFVDTVRREWANRFFFMTRGRAVMQTELIEAGHPSPATDPSLAAGLDYLLTHQQADGSWADGPATAVRETGAGVQALAIFGRDAGIGPALSAAQGWLQGTATSENDSMSRRARALLALGLPVTDSAAPNPDGGFGLAPGYASTVIDTVLVGLASREAGTFAPDVTQFLLQSQNADGGWPYLAGGPSQIDATAWALQYLAPQQSEWPVRFAGESSLFFLESCLAADGSYGLDGLPRASETAEAMLALDAWHRTLVSFPGALLALQATDGSWDGSVYETATALRALRFLSTANLMVSSDELFLSSSAATEGEIVTAHVVVHNVGREQANGIRVRAFDGLGRPYGPTGVIANILPGAGQPLELVLDTAGHAGERQVFVVVDPDGALDQTTREDDRAVAALTVNGRPQTAELFFVAGTLGLSPASLTLLPATVAATATLGNLGLGDAAGVELALAFDGQTVASAVVELPAGARVPVSLSASIDQASAPVHVTLTVDPANRVPEQREDDNVASALLGLTQAWDVQVAGVTATPNTVEQGRDLDIGYTLSNRGTAPTTASTKVTIADAAGAVVATLTPISTSMAPGQLLPAHATWRTARAGRFTARVRATASGDADPTNNEGSAAFTVSPSTRPNLLVDGAISVDPDPSLAGKPATLCFTVANDGGGAAGSFHILVAGGKPGDPPATIATLSVPGLAPGASAALSTAWAPATAGAQAIQVTADSAGEVDELDETDNVAVRTLEPRPIADLVITDGDIVPSVAAPRPGQVVPVTVSVYNAGGQAAGATTLELFVGDPALGRLVGQATIGPIPAGARSSASFRWDPQGMTGVVELVARVNAAQIVEEQRYDNDLGRRTLSIQDGALVVSNPYFSPNGDGVMDTTDVTYRLAGPVAAEVHILDAQGQTVRTLSGGAAGAGTVTWDGRDDAGGMARDGNYQVKVMASTGVGFQERGRVAVVLDTNRLRMSDVADPSMVRWVDLSKEFGNQLTANALRIMPDEQTVLYEGFTCVGPCRDGAQIAWSGFLKGPVVGGRAPTAIPWSPSAVALLGYEYYNIETDYSIYEPNADLSQDGIWFAYEGRRGDPSPSGWTNIGYGVLLVDLATGAVTEAIPPELEPDGYPTRASNVQFARGGRVWALRRRGGAPWWWEFWSMGRRIYSTGTDGSARLEIEHQEEDILTFRVSPGGERVAMLTYPSYGSSGVHLVVADLATGAERDLATYELHWAAQSPPSRDLRWTADGRSLVVAPGADLSVLGGQGWEYASIVDAETGVVRAQPLPGGAYAYSDYGNPRPKVSRVDDALVFAAEQGTETTAYLASPVGSMPTPLFDAKSRLTIHDLSPAATAILGRQYDGAAYSSAMGTLLNLGNLTAALKGAPVTGSPGIVFSGIATDAHFDRYEISARPVGSSGAFTVVRTGLTPVRDDVFGTWVPPAPGLYQAVLTVFDKAGNTGEFTTTVGWAEGAALANVLVQPPLVSPNGDGRLDTAAVSYTVVVPGQYEFRIIDAGGNTIRHVPRTEAQPGQAAFVWDGRRDDGTIAADGVYRVEAQGAAQLVEVDCTPPDVRFTLSGGYIGNDVRDWIPDDSGVAGPCAGCVLAPTTQPALDPLGAYVDYPDELALLSWQRRDPNLAGLQIQFAPEGSDQYQSVHDELTPAPRDGMSLRAEAVRGGSFRLVAWDAAGNYAHAGPYSYAGALVLTGIGDAAAFDPVNGLLTFDGQLLQRADLLEQVKSYTWTGAPTTSVPRQVPESIPFEQKVYALSFATTASAPIVSYAVSYPSPIDGAPVLDTSHVQMVAEDAILWDARALPKRPFTARFIATDADGATYETAMRFTLSPAVDACTAVELPTELGAGMRSKVSISLQVPYVNADADALASGSKLTFTPRGSSTPELVVPVRAATALDEASSSWTYAVLVGRDALQGCDYLVQLAGVTVGGETITGGMETNVCGLVVLGPTVVSAGRGRFQLAETFPGAIDGVDVRVEEGQAEVAVITVPPFDGLAAATFPWTNCPGPGIEAIPRLDPATQTGRLEFKACPAPPPQECARFEITVARHHERLPACTNAPATYSIDTTFSSADLELVSVEEHLVSESKNYVQLDTSGIGTGHVVTHHREVSTAPFAEDVYTVVGTAQVRKPAPAPAQGFTMSTVGLQTVIVDKTAPQMAIVSPAQDQRLCSITVAGQSVLPFDVQGADDFIAELSLVVRSESGGGTHQYPAGGVFDPETHFPICELSPRSFRPRVLVPAADLPPGAYLAHLESSDCSVGSFCSASRRFLVEGPAGLRSAAVMPAAFAPDGAGLASTAEFTYDVTGTGKLVARLLDDPARPRLLFATVAPSGAGSILWSGTAADGGRVEDGTHIVQLQLTDACQAKDTRTLSVAIDSVAPVVRIDSPSPGAQVGATLAVSGLVTDANLGSWTLKLAPASTPEAVRVVASGTASVHGLLGTFPMGAVSEPAQLLTLEAEDAVGHHSEITVPVQVTPRQLLAGFSVVPGLVSPNGDGRFDSAHAAAQLLGPANVELVLLDPLGGPVATVQGSRPSEGGPQEYGLDAALAGRTDGDYLVRITARSGDVAETESAPITIDETPPSIQPTFPAEGAFIPAHAVVTGDISDLHLASWSVALRTGGSEQPLSGGTGAVGGRIASLSGLPDGAHQLLFRATDAAGNPAQRTVSFVADGTPPAVSIRLASSAAFVSGALGPVSVIASAQDANLAQASVTVAGGPGTRELWSAATSPGSLSWDVVVRMMDRESSGWTRGIGPAAPPPPRWRSRSTTHCPRWASTSWRARS